MRNKNLFFVFVFLSLFVFLGTSVHAEDNYKSSKFRSFDRDDKLSLEVKSSPKPTGSPSASPSVKRLTEFKLRACEAREDAVKKRTDSLMTLTTRKVAKLDTISSKVQEFYTNKLVPQGKVISNYDALVSDIKTKKAAVESAIKEVPDTSPFDCSGDDPKGLMTDFREKMQSVKKALHEYHVSIKNLFVEVRKLAGDDDKSPKPSGTPSPTQTPKPTGD